MNSVIDIQGLRKSYGAKCVVNGVDIGFGPGRLVGLIGPNGSGKTTTLKSMLGLIPSEGALRILGYDPRTQRDAMMEEVCFVADVAILPPWLCAREAVNIVGGMHRQFNSIRARQYLAGFGLDPDLRVRHMSKGQIVQLHLALILAIDAKLLVLDEPTLGLDPLQKAFFYETLLDDFFDSEKSILISSHEITEIENLLTNILFIQNGKIVLSGTTDEISSRFAKVTVDGDKLEQARALRPVGGDEVLGQRIMMFDGVPHQRLEALGRVGYPSLAELFLFSMKGEPA